MRSSPPSIAAHWFAAPALTFGLSTRPMPYSRWRLPGSTDEIRNTPSSNFTSPSRSEFASSLLPRSTPGGIGTHYRLLSWDWLPLQRVKDRASTTCRLAVPASFHLRRFPRPWRFSPLCPVPGVSPGNTRGVPALQGLSRIVRESDLALSTPSWCLPVLLSPREGSRR